MTLLMHEVYRDNIGKFTEGCDEKVKMVHCPDYEGCLIYLQ